MGWGINEIMIINYVEAGQCTKGVIILFPTFVHFKIHHNARIKRKKI